MQSFAETRVSPRPSLLARLAVIRRQAADKKLTDILVHDGKLRLWFVTLLWLTVLACAVISILAGRFTIEFRELTTALWQYVSGHEVTNVQVGSVLLGVRLPRTVLAVFVGSGLAVAGAAFQSVFSNPLATPDTLGVAAGTSIGAVLALILEWNLLGVQLLALLFGLSAMGVTAAIARHRGRTSIVMLVLAGVIVAAIANAIISMLKLTADPTSKLPEITYWLMGSMAGVGFDAIALGAPLILLGSLAIFLLRWRLNVLALSEDEARAAGLNLKVLRPVAIVDRDQSSEQSRGAMLLAFLPYMLIIGAFVAGMYLAIDTTAGERERQSLEALLVNPEPRSHILIGKLAATTAFALTALALSLLAFMIALPWMPVGQTGLDIKLDAATAGLALLTVAPLALLAASSETLVAAFSKSFREAQTWLGMMMVLPAIPAVVLMINPVKPLAWMYWSPLVSQHVVLNQIIRGETVATWQFAASIAGTLAMGLFLAWLCVRVYHRERLAISA